MTLGVIQRRIILIAQSQIQGQVGFDLPIILKVQPVGLRAQVALGIRRLASLRAHIDRLKDGCIVGEVPKPHVAVERTCSSGKIVIVLLGGKIHTKADAVAANILSDLVTETSCVLRENRG